MKRRSPFKVTYSIAATLMRAEPKISLVELTLRTMANVKVVGSTYTHEALLKVWTDREEKQQRNASGWGREVKTVSSDHSTFTVILDNLEDDSPMETMTYLDMQYRGLS